MTELDSNCDDKELQKALAILISNTRSTKRPLPLTSVAKSLDTAVRKLGTFSEVANRVGLSTKMLRQFSYVNRLTKNAQKLVESRKLDSVDAITHLAMLPPSMQETVAVALENGEIETPDIRTIVQLYRSGSKGSTRKLIENAKAAKTQHEFIAEFVVRGSSDPLRDLDPLSPSIARVREGIAASDSLRRCRDRVRRSSFPLSA